MWKGASKSVLRAILDGAPFTSTESVTLRPSLRCFPGSRITQRASAHYSSTAGAPAPDEAASLGTQRRLVGAAGFEPATSTTPL